MSKIPRANFHPNASTKICGKHFRSQDFKEVSNDSNVYRKRNTTELAKAVLKEGAFPTIFLNCPAYLTTELPNERSFNTSASGRHAAQEELHNEEIRQFLMPDQVENVNDLMLKVNSGDLHKIFQEGILHLVLLSCEDSVPSLTLSISINAEMVVSAAVHGEKLKESVIKSFFTNKIVQYVSQIENFISFCINLVQTNERNPLNIAIKQLENCEETDNNYDVISFFLEQLHLLKFSPKARRYSTSLLTFGILIYLYSSRCYKALLEDATLTLPSERTLKRLFSNLNLNVGASNDHYFKLRKSNLNYFESHVILIIDEIYVAAKIEMSNGTFFGMHNGEPAKTMLCFMISSVCGKFQDIVNMIPVSKLIADNLHKSTISILEFLSRISFEVVAICVDNHSVNRKLFKILSNGAINSKINNPITKKPLFLMFDTTHNMKNIYNNFLNRQIFHFFKDGDVEPTVVNFSDIVSLYNYEQNRSLKLAHKLNKTVLNPASIQKVSVKLASSLFDESTSNALKYYSKLLEKPSWSETATFLTWVKKIWNILNVKTISKGKHKQREDMYPINSVIDEKIDILSSYEADFQKWKNSNEPGLSTETFSAMIVSLKSIKLIALHLLENVGFNYVLTGKLNSDPIERRFGRYRQLSGGNFYISAKNVAENERKIRILSLIRHSGVTIDEIKQIPISTVIIEDEEVDFFCLKLNLMI